MLFQFNFVGKLLGPKGNSMKRLQEETMTKMAVLGRGSMRDKQKVHTYKEIWNFFPDLELFVSDSARIKEQIN